MINFHARGDPKRLLRFINPKEASLLDPFLAIHVRFRLGVPPTASSLTNNGEQKSERRRGDFPPTIYYKIFVHERMVDLNAFSPRNYTQMHCKQPLPKQLFLKDEKTPISGKDRSKSTTSKGILLFRLFSFESDQDVHVPILLLCRGSCWLVPAIRK